MDHSVIFKLICPKLQLYTKSAKKYIPYLKQTPFKYPKQKFASEIDHFVILPKLTQSFPQFQIEQNEN